MVQVADLITKGKGQESEVKGQLRQGGGRIQKKPSKGNRSYLSVESTEWN